AQDGDAKKKDLKDFDPQWLVVDTAAGANGDSLRDAVRRADVMLFRYRRRRSTWRRHSGFLACWPTTRPVKQGDLALGIVAMRVDSRTRAAAELDEFLKEF